jgi:hypothetical protein
MTWIEKIERRFGHLAIPHLLRYVALLNGLVFLLHLLNPEFLRYLDLNPQAIREGQIWRLLSHVFIPRIGGAFPAGIEVVFYLMFLNWLGDGLEEAMGAFALNLYYLLGIVGTTAAAFLTGHSDGGFLLNNSLLFAFAWFYPNMQIFVLFILPLKVKWLAWLDAGFVAFYFLTSGWSTRLGILASLANFVIFFGPQWMEARKTQRRNSARRETFQEAMEREETLHCCAVCNRSEMSTPDMEFRVARDGHEYCVEHLPKTR